ncbi:MAG: hypothetical protein NZM04_09385, partial [Methylacidiphilales bacterium]|nr:hypothetical protein [Candidatus Methylacidiphilales bacterium]
LAAIKANVNNEGHNRVNPCVCGITTAYTTSHNPAATTHHQGLTPSSIPPPYQKKAKTPPTK